MTPAHVLHPPPKQALRGPNTAPNRRAGSVYITNDRRETSGDAVDRITTWIFLRLPTRAAFDATALDWTTARFGPTGAESPALDSASEDVDGDGTADLVLTFDVGAMGIRCGDTSATITASRLDGYAVSGSGPISTVGCR